MRIEHFRYCFSRLNGFYLKEHLIMFRKPLELWNEQTGESNTFKTIEDALKYKIDGETIEDIILSTDTLYIPPITVEEGARVRAKHLSLAMQREMGEETSRGAYFLLMPIRGLRQRILRQLCVISEKIMLILTMNGHTKWMVKDMYINMSRGTSQAYVLDPEEETQSSCTITQTVELFQMQTLSAQLWTGNQVPSWQVGKSMTIFSKKERISRAIHSLKQ